VYSSLRNSILSLNLVPGAIISENDISARFKVSRTPVREAFIALSKEALINVIPQKGSMVSRIDFARVEQELFLRENLEPPVLKQFLKNHNPSHLAELGKYIELQDEAVRTREFERFLLYDNLFHKAFFGNQKVAWEAIENMCGHYIRFRLLTLWFQERIKDIVKEHKLLFQTIKQKDSTGALALLKTHIHKINKEEPILRRLFPDYFVDSSEAEPFKVDFGGMPLLSKKV